MRALLILFLIMLGGCARNEGVYPSLGQRPIERLGFDEPDIPSPGPVAADVALDVEVAAATSRLDKVTADFARAAGASEPLARRARRAAAGSEEWLDAQTALAGLDVLRTDTSEVVADLERLVIARAATLAPDYPALEEARTRARTELERQEGVIARLGSELAPA